MKKLAGNILIVDDDDYILLTLRMFLEQHFTSVITINNPNQISNAYDERSYDLVILDMNFKEGETSGEDGLRWLGEILKIDADASVIMMTAYGGVNIAVEAIKQGAKDFIVKPWENERLLATVTSIYNLSSEKKNVRQLKSQQKVINSTLDEPFTNIVGNSDAIETVFKSINKVAATNAEVLILGENGTGKELVARAIHRNSERKDGVFISVDLGSISETLFESELFGHKKGAFTDAKEDRIGRFEAAMGGTIFLDEIGNLPMALQAKLLTVVQNRKVTRLGTNDPINIDVRIICATNKPLLEMAKEGEFREDLLYRINTVEIAVPPLKERIADIPLLTEHFVQLFARKYDKEDLEISKDVFSTLQKYPWPGNVRELQHAIERAVIMTENSSLNSQDFMFLSASALDGDKPHDYNLESLEEWAVRNAIKKHQGNISHAAKELGLSRGAMYRRMEKYGL